MTAKLNLPQYPPVMPRKVVLGAKPTVKSLVKVQAESTPRKSS